MTSQLPRLHVEIWAIDPPLSPEHTERLPRLGGSPSLTTTPTPARRRYVPATAGRVYTSALGPRPPGPPAGGGPAEGPRRIKEQGKCNLCME